MRTQAQYFPHIYRFITAVTIFWHVHVSEKHRHLLKKYLGILLLFVYLIFSLIYPGDKYEKIRSDVYGDHKNAQKHLVLSQALVQNNDFNRALVETKIASSLATFNSQAETQLLSIKQLIDTPKELQSSLNIWTKISETHPDYRDAFMQKSVLEWQLMNYEDAKKDINKALGLDPNFTDAIKLQSLLNL